GLTSIRNLRFRRRTNFRVARRIGKRLPAGPLMTNRSSSRISIQFTKRHTATVVLFTLLALLMFGADKPATKDTIWLDTDLQLGLSKQIVMSRLAEHYKLVRVGELGDSWTVQSKDSPVATHGQVT